MSANRTKWTALAIGIALIIGAASFYPWLRVWLLLIPDCAPHQQDGQCGLATFLDAAVAIPSAIVTGVIAGVTFFRRKTRPATYTKDDGNPIDLRLS